MKCIDDVQRKPWTEEKKRELARWYFKELLPALREMRDRDNSVDREFYTDGAGDA